MVKWYIAGKLMNKDMRTTVTYEPDKCRIFLEIKKCRDKDEASYKIVLCDKEGQSLDFAGFSVFVKGRCFKEIIGII